MHIIMELTEKISKIVSYCYLFNKHIPYLFTYITFCSYIFPALDNHLVKARWCTHMDFRQWPSFLKNIILIKGFVFFACSFKHLACDQFTQLLAILAIKCYCTVSFLVGLPCELIWGGRESDKNGFYSFLGSCSPGVLPLQELVRGKRRKRRRVSVSPSSDTSSEISSGMSSSSSSIVLSPPGEGRVMGLQGSPLPLAPEAGASRRRRRPKRPMVVRRLDCNGL